MDFDERLNKLRNLADDRLDDNEDIDLINDTILFLKEVKRLSENMTEQLS